MPRPTRLRTRLPENADKRDNDRCRYFHDFLAIGFLAHVAHPRSKESRSTRRASLSAPFNIFKQQPDGNAYWIAAAEDLESAKARVLDLLESFPGQYVIVDNATGEKTFVPMKQ